MNAKNVLLFLVAIPGIGVLLLEIIVRLVFKGREGVQLYLSGMAITLITEEKMASKILRNLRIYGAIIWFLIFIL